MLGLERVGVQSRFILLMLLVSLGSILAIGWIGYQTARSALTNAVQNHLQSVRHSKTSGLRTILEALRDQVLSLSDGKLVGEAMLNFKQAYRGLGEERLTAEQEESLRSYYTTHFLPKLKDNLGGIPQPEQYIPAEPFQRYLQYHYLEATHGSVDPRHRLDRLPVGPLGHHARGAKPPAERAALQDERPADNPRSAP